MSACISVSSTAWTPCKMAAPWRPSRITSSTGSARGKPKITTDVGEEQEPEEEREAEAEKEEGVEEEEEEEEENEEEEEAAAAMEKEAVETWQTRCMWRGK